MKRNLFVFVFIFFVFVSHAQRFNGYVVTNANDTIKCKFSLTMNLFDERLFYDAQICNRALIYKENGEKVKYKPSELKSIFITGPAQGDYKFVSLKEDPKHFYHEKIKGRLSFYILYKSNIRGGFPLQVDYVLKDGNLVDLSSFSPRKKFGEFIEDYPELYEKWMDSNNFYKLGQKEEVVKLYNEHFEK